MVDLWRSRLRIAIHQRKWIAAGGLRHGAQSRIVGFHVPRISLEHENAHVTCSSGKLRSGVLLSLAIAAASMSASTVTGAVYALLVRREKLNA